MPNTSTPLTHQSLSVVFSCLLCLAALCSATRLQAQTVVQWQKALGGHGFDVLQNVQPTRDGGYIMAGNSASATSGDKSATTRGTHDYWVVKVDALGNKQWDKTFGGSKEDFLQVVQPTSDGGYILGGYSSSPISGDKTQSPRGSFDFWIVKLDAAGNKKWDKTLGGGKDDFLQAVQQTADGGYLLGGSSNSASGGIKTASSKGEFDYWILKVDANGNRVWDKTIGGSGYDYLKALQQTSDKGFLLGGFSYSPVSGNKSGAVKGYGDFWLVKVDALGNQQWDKTLGGSREDVLQVMQPTPDGGFVLAGSSDSPSGGDKAENTKGDEDYWMIKVDASGNKQWDNTFGGSASEVLTTLQPTLDGGYLLGGTSTSGSSGTKTTAARGGKDAWLVKVDAQGNQQWENTLGGTQQDGLQALLPLANGSYLVGGYSNADGTANYDFWLAAVAANQAPIATAGAGQTITLPTASVSLAGAGTDADGTISAYAWSQVSGPAAASFSSTAVANPTVNGLVAGSYVFSLTVTDNHQASSTASLVSVTVNPAPVVATSTLSSLTLINADTDQDLLTLTAGATLNLAALPTRNLNIRANVAGAPAGSVVFALSGAQLRNAIQNTQPYSLFNDYLGDYYAWTPAAGSYSLTATPYSLSKGTGTAGTALTVDFTVVNQPLASKAAVEKESLSRQPVTVYPNPASSRLFIQAGQLTDEAATITLYDLSGRAVRTQQLNPTASGLQVELEVNTIKEGAYILAITSANHSSRQHVVIAR